MATSFGQDFKNENRLTVKQFDVLDDLSGYDLTDPPVMAYFPTRTISALTKRGLVNEQGITALGRDVLNAHV